MNAPTGLPPGHLQLLSARPFFVAVTRIILHKETSPYMIEAGGKTVAICGCGMSSNKPYCDGSHAATAKEEPDKLYQYPDNDDEKGGKPVRIESAA